MNFKEKTILSNYEITVEEKQTCNKNDISPEN